MPNLGENHWLFTAGPKVAVRSNVLYNLMFKKLKHKHLNVVYVAQGMYNTKLYIIMCYRRETRIQFERFKKSEAF